MIIVITTKALTVFKKAVIRVCLKLKMNEMVMKGIF